LWPVGNPESATSSGAFTPPAQMAHRFWARTFRLSLQPHQGVRMEEVNGSPGTEQQAVAGGPPIDVADEAQLIKALNPQNAGRTIRLQSPVYQVDTPLVVPDATLQGAGMMQVVDGLPVGFQGVTTRINAKPNFEGNLLTLRDGSKVQKLVLQGASEGLGFPLELRRGCPRRSMSR
jgi:hypothetical protein